MMHTINKNIEHEIIIKNSRFITILIKINNKEDITKNLETCKINYPRATHYCYAYKIGETIKKASDDGEPSGTAGLPMLNVLDKENITNILVIVIRYFGGIKLGAGGLIRAYTKSVKDALNEIEKKELVPAILCEITFPYTKEQELKKEIKEENIISKTYLENITYQMKIPKTSTLLQDKNIKILEDTYIEKS